MHELLRATVSLCEDADPARLVPLAAGVQDWRTLFQEAHEHRLLPLLFQQLSQIGPELSQEIYNRLEVEYQRNYFHTVANRAELLGILQEFAQESIAAMPFKGVALAASIYPDPFTRMAGDIDLLIDVKDLQRATAILQKRGFELITETLADGAPANPDYYEFHFERAADGMVLELRWRLELAYARYRRDYGMAWIWPRRRVVDLAGAAIPAMSPESTLVVLCMHGSKHAWSRLIWIYDVGRLLAATPELNWTEVAREAREFGLWRTVALGVLLAHRLTGVPVQVEMLRKLRSDAKADKLAQHFEKTVLETPGCLPPGRLPYNIQLLAARDRMGVFFSSEYLRPNERDRAAVRLPGGLHLLYYVVRPLRILLDRSAR